MQQFSDDPIMEPVHQIREELYQQFKNSGLTYMEWLKATEQEFTASLAEIGFKIITKDGFQYLVEI
jgi:hypothetical protein